MDLVKSFPKRLRWLRERKGLTQSALSRQAGLHPETVGGIERGTRRLGIHGLLGLADALNVSLDFVLGRWKKEPLRDASVEESPKQPQSRCASGLIISQWGASERQQQLEPGSLGPETERPPTGSLPSSRDVSGKVVSVP